MFAAAEREIHGSFSQTVTQTLTTINGMECQSVTITCRFHPGITGTYRFQTGRFFRVTQPGSERQQITSRGRFVVRSNRNEMTFSLEIRDLRVEDSATYYCQAEYRWNTHTYKQDGTGTTVTVTADSISPGSQIPVQPSTAGETVTLNCEYSGFCPYTLHWYRQFPGQAPIFMLQRHTSGEQDTENAAGGRMSASLDPGKKISQLTISKVNQSDAAQYYCALTSRTAH
ncbi:T cell receptor alpha chain MC.7.G5-like [Pristis pectinata]|uniref:T cell receptor alpha chain MC.7.G5-like n=1 Tax=Pristis pectinata TaxID=685728 RepID=UPI00223D510F|nr:T cell receptor alpha chain MC.7.G5-like [Pristis pectinata]